MRIDYHMHTPLCKHATGAPWQYAEYAVKIGLDEIGFSDHCPMPNGFDAPYRMSHSQMEQYLAIVEDARRRFPQLSIKFGIEADFHPGTQEYVKDLINSWPFDYIIGSVHYIGEWGFDNPDLVAEFDRHEIDQVWKDYFELWKEAAASGMFDTLAHPDLVKKFGHRPKGDLTRFYRNALEVVARNKVAIELSSAGLRKPVGEIYPSDEFIQLAYERGISITLGSDAHSPQEVGFQMDLLVNAARKAGYTTITRFSKRRGEQVSF